MSSQFSDWQAYLVQTTTGAVGPAVTIKEDAKYSIPLSDGASGSFQIDKSAMPVGLPLERWLDAWWSTILFTYKGKAIYAGPILSTPKEYLSEIQCETGDIRNILSRRYIIRESVLDGSGAIGKGVTSFDGMSLGTIAQEVVKVALAKPGGNLPVTYVSPRETAANDADHQRTYKAYNVSNLSCEDVLQKISGVGNGPDITFRPRLLAPNRMTWDMYHGTENNPRIKQEIVPEWDLTAVQSQAASLEVTKTGTYITDRVIGVGSGTNEAAVMTVTENLSRLDDGYPLLESVHLDSDTKTKTLLTKQATENLKQNRKPLREFTLYVDANGHYRLGSYWPGDLVIVHTKGFADFSDGPQKMRLLNVSGGFGSTKVRLALQLDDQWK